MFGGEDCRHKKPMMESRWPFLGILGGLAGIAAAAVMFAMLRLLVEHGRLGPLGWCVFVVSGGLFLVLWFSLSKYMDPERRQYLDLIQSTEWLKDSHELNRSAKIMALRFLEVLTENGMSESLTSNVCLQLPRKTLDRRYLMRTEGLEHFVQRIVILLSTLLCFVVPVRAGTGEGHGRDAIAAWVTASPDLRMLGSAQVEWPDTKQIESFFPLGFSEDGWFAHSNRTEGLLLDRTLGICHGEVPCFEVSLFNVFCDNPCAGDIDPSAGAKCKCYHGVLVRHLEEFGIRPQEDLRFGEFPAYFGDIEYDIELTFREKAIFSELWQETRKPEFPETRAFLVADGKKRKLVGSIDHNHSDVGIGVRVAGWIEHLESGRIIVLLLVHRAWSDTYSLYPIAAEPGG